MASAWESVEEADLTQLTFVVVPESATPSKPSIALLTHEPGVWSSSSISACTVLSNLDTIHKESKQSGPQLPVPTSSLLKQLLWRPRRHSGAARAH